MVGTQGRYTPRYQYQREERGERTEEREERRGKREDRTQRDEGRETQGPVVLAAQQEQRMLQLTDGSPARNRCFKEHTSKNRSK